MPAPLPQLLARTFLCALCAFAALPSCGKLRYGGTLSQDQALAALRAENHQLKDDVAAKGMRIAELEAKLTGPINADALRALPAVASIEIDRFSGVEERGGQRTTVIYLRTLDGNGRFIQATGSLTLEVSQKDDSTHTLFTEFSPEQLRASFRSSFLGTFYVLRVPYGLPAAPSADLTARVSFVDAVTGKLHTTERRIGPQARAERTARAGEQGV